MSEAVLDNQEPRQQKARLAVVQYEVKRIGSFADFAEQCSFFVRTAADYKADFVLFPELLTTQLLTFMPDKGAKAALKLAQSAPQYVELFSTLARETQTYVIAGSHLCQENGKIYNISYVFDRSGKSTKQYKLHITPHEKDVWGVEPGAFVEVIDTDCGKIAVLICYDIEFPELSRIAVHKGANIIFVPSNTDQRFGYLRVRYCAQARCIENQVYVAVSGCTGNMPTAAGGEIHYSQSAIFTPSDLPFAQEAIAAQCAENVETMIIQDVDLSLLQHNRNKGAVRPWHDRRPDLYQLHYQDAAGKQQM